MALRSQKENTKTTTKKRHFMMHLYRILRHPKPISWYSVEFLLLSFNQSRCLLVTCFFHVCFDEMEKSMVFKPLEFITSWIPVLSWWLHYLSLVSFKVETKNSSFCSTFVLLSMFDFTCCFLCSTLFRPQCLKSCSYIQQHIMVL